MDRHSARLVTIFLNTRSGLISKLTGQRRRIIGLITAIIWAGLTVFGAPSALAIVGGQVAPTTPWVVALQGKNGALFCGGALIAPDRVVTAAHCAVEQTLTGTRDRRPSEITAILGRSDLRTNHGQQIVVDKIWRHSDFRDVSTGDDIAVLTLTTRAPYQPVSLGQAHAGAMATVYGWGRTGELSPPSQQLRQVDLPIQDDATCAREVSGFRPTVMLCAGYPEGGKDACAGDSGGPITVEGKLVGIVSYGHGCARPNQYGVYTELEAYRPL